mmetsp:Transcript_7523/g.27621  ORF Transcript_7523/g.27621 Transcript_7523/m.27621 type:complete len:1050 (-) Transcript_7523:204-3353(-)|eukprot:scaffold1254_cov376-Prasinococcus_capsulatus_cf.AAC.10
MSLVETNSAEVKGMVDALFAAPSAEAAEAAASKIVEGGLGVVKGTNVTGLLKEAAGNKKSKEAREGAMLLYAGLASSKARALEPALAELLGPALELLGDKQKPVQTAAEAAVAAVVKAIQPHECVPANYLPSLIEALKSSKWQTKVTALQTLASLSKTSPKQVAEVMPDILPNVTDLLFDTKADVCKAAKASMTEICSVIDNRDIEPFVPHLVSAMSNPEEVSECIQQLAATTFVQVVARAELALIEPLLARGFKERKHQVSRQCAVIVVNMSKLVEKATEAAPLFPKLIPALERAGEDVSDPEARAKCSEAFEQMSRLAVRAEELAAALQSLTVSAIVDQLKPKLNAPEAADDLIKYAAVLVSQLANMQEWGKEQWQANMVPYLSALVPEDRAAEIAEELRAGCEEVYAKAEKQEEEDEDAEELCNCKFTLAYGSKILLHNTEMRLMRGYRYGLLGANDSGKTTLMRAIANEQVDGFPPATELRTVFVEADIQGEMSHLSCIDYVFMDERIKNCGIPRDEVTACLKTVGFTDKMCENGVSTLSGGWRMKLALARAMLQKADILLLDEPTNHLDVINVAWVQNYLNSLTNVTSIIVSHDSGLLDNVCTHILQIEDLKLHLFKGNLSAFVKLKPQAKSFFELKSTKGLKFNFPAPGYLEGVTSKGKPLMKMDGVTFTYPGNDKPTITGITVRVSLSSRVACVGVNGAGKSTMIKLLTGELEPQEGTVWKHPNAKVAYVAQHAFHHIENHLNKTPNEYILWRYQGGEDKEGLEKVTMKFTEEEKEKMSKKSVWEIEDPDGKLQRVKRVVKRLTGMRKELKKKYTYEVEWEGMKADDNSYVTQEDLEKNGWEKVVKQVNEKIAAREGAYRRPLTKANVEKHIEDIGLDKEYGTHHRISALSGGQKVKVVLAAALWAQPHIIILDEPTNYLDRESLGALAEAIRGYEGGVVMITHNNQFCSELCPETWVLEKGEDGIGHLDCKGDPDWMKHQTEANDKVEFKAMDEVVDALGNVSKVKKPKKTKLSRKELKAREKAKKRAMELGEDWPSSDED